MVGQGVGAPRIQGHSCELRPGQAILVLAWALEATWRALDRPGVPARLPVRRERPGKRPRLKGAGAGVRPKRSWGWEGPTAAAAALPAESTEAWALGLLAWGWGV